MMMIINRIQSARLQMKIFMYHWKNDVENKWVLSKIVDYFLFDIFFSYNEFLVVRIVVIHIRIIQVIRLHLMVHMSSKWRKRLRLDHKRILHYLIKWVNWRKIKVEEYFWKFYWIILNWLDLSDQTSTDKMLEEEERILQNVVETKGKRKILFL